MDTGLNVTRYESEPTFDGSFFAREFEEPSVRGKANDDNLLFGASSAYFFLSKKALCAYCKGCSKVILNNWVLLRLLKGLSHVTGNCHAWFLGELELETAPVYPSCINSDHSQIVCIQELFATKP